jgi:hypothetical protein
MFVTEYIYDAKLAADGDKLMRQRLHRNKAIIMIHDSKMIEKIRDLQAQFDDLKCFEIFVVRPDVQLLNPELIAEYGLVVHVSSSLFLTPCM